MPSVMEIVTESLRFHKLFSFRPKEHMQLQQFRQEQERLQKVVTSFSAVKQVTSTLSTYDPFPTIATGVRSVVDGFIPSSLKSPFSFVTVQGSVDAQLAAFREEASLFRKAEEVTQTLINPDLPLWLAPWRPIDEQWQGLRPQQYSQTAERRKAVRRHMCAATLQAFSNDPELVKWFITEALGLPFSSSCLGMVWQALHAGEWQSVDWPLTHVRQFVVRLHAQDAEENGNLLSTTGSNDEEQSRLALQEHDGHGQLARPLTMHARGRCGRPTGSGIYATPNDFLNTVVPLIQSLRQEGTYPSQQRVVDSYPIKTDTRQLRAWLHHFGLSWQNLLNT